MRTTPASMRDVFAKRAKLLDEMVERAEVRRIRAFKLGNQREVDGATKTIEESKERARLLRAKSAEHSPPAGANRSPLSANG